MKTIKRTGLLVVVIFSLLLAGCLSPSIALRIEPIEIKQGDDEIDVNMEFKLSGFAFKYELDKVVAVIVDSNGNELLPKFEKKLNLSFPVAPLITHNEEITISLMDADFYPILMDPD